MSQGATSDNKAPALTGKAWINATVEQQKQLLDFKGHVTILHFWTFDCINCKHNLPSVATWAKAFPTDKVSVIGVHTPELPEERNIENVKAAVKRLGITYPILVDGDNTNWNHYKLKWWPTVFVIDQKGQVQQIWEGEMGWNGADGFQQITRTVQRLLKDGA